MDFVSQRKRSFISGSKGLCQVSSKLEQNCDQENADTHTDTQTDRDDTGDLIICPMLCYSNGTDNKYECTIKDPERTCATIVIWDLPGSKDL